MSVSTASALVMMFSVLSLRKILSSRISTRSDTAGGGGAPTVEEARDWSEMTSDCLTNIFLRLDLEDRWKGPKFVCRSWLDASRDASLFTSFDLPARRRRIGSMFQSLVECRGDSVREIRLRRCNDSSLTIVAERCPNLEVLSIQSCRNVTDISAFKIAAGCPMLRELDISNCYEISYKSIQVIGENCPNLVMLKRNLLKWIDPYQHVGVVPEENLRACPIDGDREAGTIAKFMPKLKHLELRFSKLSTRGLDLISKACADLEYLDMFGCANLTSRAVEQASANLKKLRTFLKPNLYIPRSVFHTLRYGHWRGCMMKGFRPMFSRLIRCRRKFHG